MKKETPYRVGDLVAAHIQHPGELMTAFMRVGVVTEEDDGRVYFVRYILDEDESERDLAEHLTGASSDVLDEKGISLDREALIDAIIERGEDRFFTYGELRDFFKQYAQVPA